MDEELPVTSGTSQTSDSSTSQTSDSGISTPRPTRSSTTSLSTTSSTTQTPAPTDDGNGSGSGANVGAIVGGALGGLAALAAVGVAAWLLLRRRKNPTPEIPVLQVTQRNPSTYSMVPQSYDSQINVNSQHVR
ncbi:hypothetical protein HRG_000837 [Hirsutella rhossiliensis]|uniref:Mid2 domain-containing protein n=1 Tax=Hirsutella rhossiliensis TaxID=111463 RepID=A0A9P8SNS7_9HYPO|nr:uncharacterized protein HRG_00837 [Hirsutella rhossiliensis]KAH0968195.1 hypothetical protein HRG_00837 [Hirsutella rhossiliensis]